MSTIHTHRLIDVADWSITKAYADVYLVQDEGDRELHDGSALIIAAMWESPGTVGAEFARLTTTGEADLTALLDDMHHTRREASTWQDRLALDCLATWAMNHPSLTED